MKNKIAKYFPSLSHANFRYYWYGQLISLVGTWMQRMGQAWLVYTLTNSPFKLGLIGTLHFLPILLFSLIAGVFVDRYPKKKIIIITQIISMLLAFTLAALVLFKVVQYYQIAILALLLGIINALDMPSRQSFIIELVGREDLPNAVALNSTSFNLARVIGPVIAGIVMANFNIGWCFFFNGVSFIGVLYGLMKIKLNKKSNNATANDKIEIKTKKTLTMRYMLTEIKDGLRYVCQNKTLLFTSIMLFYIGTLAFNFSILIPILAKDILGLREKGFGLLMSSLGFGSLIGALFVSIMIKGKIKNSRKIMVTANIFIAITLTLLGIFHNLYLIILTLFFCGISNLFFSITANSTLQLHSDDQHRGRVMSVYTLFFAGTTPIGNFITGLIAEKWGADKAFIICGILLLISLITLLTYFSKLKRHLHSSLLILFSLFLSFSCTTASSTAGSTKENVKIKWNNPWAQIKTPYLKAPAESIGSYSRGCLSGAKAIEINSPGLNVMRLSRNRIYGHPYLIDFLIDVGKEIEKLNVGNIFVGDISQPRGGPSFSGHASHHNGLDVDIWFKLNHDKHIPSTEERENLSAKPFEWSNGNEQILKLFSSKSEVDRIFVAADIKKKLCTKYKNNPANIKWLSKIRPWWGHDDHLHLRLKCPNSSSCIPQAAVASSTHSGCDKSLEWWFSAEAKRVLAENRERERQNKDKFKMPILPEKCKSLLYESAL
ncbi:MAG: penicillin-insensitive murein endopeptidase [Oligoflexia bacterium]|nr:penicillin-insensitive murein endopeptidase [Oligoflexia bacterium]